MFAVMRQRYAMMSATPHVRGRKYPLKGTKTSVASRIARSPRPVMNSVVENSSGYASLVWRVMYVPVMPIPRRMLSIGPPKHAEKPMMGAKTATLMLATRSARELPTAKMVSPMIASDRPKMRPNV